MSGDDDGSCGGEKTGYIYIHTLAFEHVVTCIGSSIIYLFVKVHNLHEKKKILNFMNSLFEFKMKFVI